MVAYAQLRELYPHLKFSAALLDSAHDAYDIYRLLIEHDIEPFIDLNKRKSGIRTRSAVNVNDDGVPICIAGKEMKHSGACKGRRRIKWRCCMHKQPNLCEYQKQCSPSPYGRVFYTKMKDDFRLFTQTPRGSKAWKKAFAKRTSVERTIKRILVDYLFCPAHFLLYFLLLPYEAVKKRFTAF
ncbi:hypothetical protein [Desulfitibacter alkalitolerans]|uniref:hypothetical protein n=1 Tax=Desulfitibacter alkalitolerans TaxID=264641 RepID=UPI0006871D0E|nr:hypothetical protein [Desulfitibacter alkalitolerans]